MHLMHRVLLEPPVAMRLYKDKSSCNTSSHFTHTLLTPSHTTVVNMPHYLILSTVLSLVCQGRIVLTMQVV
jgi:hypothetical protein